MCDRKSDVFIVPKKFCQHKQNGGKGDTFHRFGEETTVQTRRADNMVSGTSGINYRYVMLMILSVVLKRNMKQKYL